MKMDSETAAYLIGSNRDNLEGPVFLIKDSEGVGAGLNGDGLAVEAGPHEVDAGVRRAHHEV